MVVKGLLYNHERVCTAEIRRAEQPRHVLFTNYMDTSYINAEPNKRDTVWFLRDWINTKSLNNNKWYDECRPLANDIAKNVLDFKIQTTHNQTCIVDILTHCDLSYIDFLPIITCIIGEWFFRCVVTKSKHIHIAMASDFPIIYGPHSILQSGEHPDEVYTIQRYPKCDKLTLSSGPSKKYNSQYFVGVANLPLTLILQSIFSTEHKKMAPHNHSVYVMVNYRTDGTDEPLGHMENTRADFLYDTLLLALLAHDIGPGSILTLPLLNEARHNINAISFNRMSWFLFSELAELITYVAIAAHRNKKTQPTNHDVADYMKSRPALIF